MTWKRFAVRNSGLHSGGVLLALVLGLARVAPAALLPEQVLVVANRHVPAGMELATYYTKRRGIPAANILGVWSPDAETCSREAYLEQIAGPVRTRLLAPGGAELRAVVLCYGVPLKVQPPVPSREEQTEIEALEAARRALVAEPGDTEGEGDARRDRLESLIARLKQLRRADQGAAVDSELALVRSAAYPLSGWLPNPAFVGASGSSAGLTRWDVLIVARLDGPTPGIAQRLVDDALAAEAAGLSGGAYLDARWPAPTAEGPLEGYALYDRSLHRAAEGLQRRGWAVTVDAAPELFPAGAALPAALYSGWYSLARYVDAFRWQRGAVGYHIASSEAATLRAGGSQVWCKRMLEEGIAATLGPVAEPYVQAFPPPEVFFDLLTRGTLSLGEVYLRSIPHFSWQMVLIGDPLYRPLRAP